MNVRCPHCSAIFPAAVPGDGSGVQVECPLCLYKFEARGELTVSAPQWASQPVAEVRPGNEDEFERFGGPARGQTSTGIASLANRGTSATPTVTLGSQRGTISGAHTIDAGADDIDFESLLGDALDAVDKRERPRTSAFQRIALTRSGTSQGTDDIHAREEPAAPSMRVNVPGTTGAGAIGYGHSNPFEDGDEAPLPGIVPLGSGNGDPFASGLDDSLFDANAMPSTDFGADDFGGGQAEPFARPRPQPIKLGKQPETAGKGKKGKGGLPSITFDHLLATAMVIAGIGVAMDYAGMGLFGRDLYWPASKPAPIKVERPVPKDLATPVQLLDTRETYESELARLDRIAAIRPDDAENRSLLERRWLDLMERFPESLLEDADLNKRLAPQMEQLATPRRKVLDAIAKMELDNADALLAGLKLSDPDDAGTAARFYLRRFVRKLNRQALQSPGLTAAAEVDPLRLPGRDDPDLQQARKILAPILAGGKAGQSAYKLLTLDAELAERLGQLDGLVPQLEAVTTKARDHLESRLQLASVHLELGHLDQAKGLLAVAKDVAERTKRPQAAVAIGQVEARIAARLGDRAAMISALAPLLALTPTDELLTVRLGRLYLAEKRTQDAQTLLVKGQAENSFSSIAFEVVLVELWLQINRPEDALEEIKRASAKHPESIELIYVRGQVEDKQQHYATARDLFAEVLAKQPQHLRAALRLAELQTTAKRYDEALATLMRTRQAVGDEETLVRMTADALLALKRLPEARQTVDMLLTLQPDNRQYLLLAARLDLEQGKTEQALTYLRKLRQQKNLDKEAAVAMAKALAQRGDKEEAAETITPFADAEPNSVELNTLAGTLQLDAGRHDRAATLLARAVAASAGKVAEPQFQWGRLAFATGETNAGVMRVRQSIALDPLAHEYRFELAQQLLRLTTDKASRALAMDELRAIVGGAAGFEAQGRPVRYLAEVHKLLARALLKENRFAMAVPALRAALALNSGDLDSKTELGRALYMMGKEEGIEALRSVLRARPNDPKAALYLALHLVREGKQSEAMTYLHRAAASGEAEYAEAFYHLALLYKERSEPVRAFKLLGDYLDKSRPSDPYRKDAESVRRALARQIGDGG